MVASLGAAQIKRNVMRIGFRPISRWELGWPPRRRELRRLLMIRESHPPHAHVSPNSGSCAPHDQMQRVLPNRLSRFNIMH